MAFFMEKSRQNKRPQEKDEQSSSPLSMTILVLGGVPRHDGLLSAI